MFVSSNFGFLIITVFLMVTLYSACDDETIPDTSNWGNIVEITDDITIPTVWSGDSIYVIRAWDFHVENTLTIEPGTIIKFHPEDGPILRLAGSGTIIANGTNAKRIIFTSYKADGHGGDTNGDGLATTAAAGDWIQINTGGLLGSIFNYCDFCYGGAYENGTLELFDSRATVTNCRFIHNTGGKSGDFYYGALDASDARLNTLITGNSFYFNDLPLCISSFVNIDDSNSFAAPDGSPGNTYNGIFYNTVEDIENHLSWRETEVAFVIDDNQLWIDDGASLTLGNNVVIYLSIGSQLVLDDGPSSLSNHGGSGVFFTSYKDDSLKGDTNGDGSITSPGLADWLGIYDNTSGVYPYYCTWGNILYSEY